MPDEIGGKVGESLRANLDQLALSRELATIRCDVELELEPAELLRRAPDTESCASSIRGSNSIPAAQAPGRMKHCRRRKRSRHRIRMRTTRRS
jgi:5'-3' exonuclease